MVLEKIGNYFNLVLSSGTGALSLLIATLFLLKLFQRLVKWLTTGRKWPPGPTGLPVVGFIPFLGKEPCKTFWNMRKEYGNIIGFYLGSKYTVVLNDYDLMKQVLCHPAALNRATSLFENLGAEGLMTDNGEKWQEQRKYVMSTARELGLGKGIWENLIMEEIQTFTEAIKKWNGKPTDFSYTLTYSLLSSVIVLFTNRRLNEPDKIKTCIEFLNCAFVFSNPISATSSVPGLRKLYEVFKIAGYDRFSKVNRKFGEFLMDQIDRHKTVPEYMNERSFINLYLEKLSEMSKLGSRRHYFSEAELRGHLTALLIGNNDTTFSSLTWLFRLMCQHQQIQDKVYKEIMEAVGKEGRARYEEKDKVPYTFAVIMESLRYASILPLNATRITIQDIPINGYIIPKGTEIISNIWGIHHDPDYWDEPDVFRPERFLSEDGTKLIKHSTNFVPFSIGHFFCY